MKAMILKAVSPIEKKPLRMINLLLPEPDSREILIRILVCGVCHTKLDEIACFLA